MPTPSWSAVLFVLALAARPLAAAPSEEPASKSMTGVPVTSGEQADSDAAPAAEETQAAADEPEAAPAPDATAPAEQEAAPPSAAPAAPAAQEAAAAPAGPDIFNTAWKDATPDEQAVFLEANPEISKEVKDKWDKDTPAKRKAAMGKHSSLASRALKHRWAEATPDEKAAFLASTADAKKRIKENWDLLSAEQRLEVVKKHPSSLRKALHQTWTEATPEEKAAFVYSQPDLRRNFVALRTMTGDKAVEEGPPEEQAKLVTLISKIDTDAQERWKKFTPGERATSVQKWPGWKLQPSMIGAPRSETKKSAKSSKKSSKKSKSKSKSKAKKKKKASEDEDQ